MTNEKICYRDGKICDFKESDDYDCVECKRKSVRQREMKVKWSELSNDLKVLCRLYEYIFIGVEDVWFNKLVESFDGDLTRSDVSKSQDKMYDLGIIDGEYKKTPDGKYTYCFFIEDEAIDFARTIFERTQEKPEVRTCPKCGKQLSFKYENRLYHNGTELVERFESTFGCFNKDGCGWFDDD